MKPVQKPEPSKREKEEAPSGAVHQGETRSAIIDERMKQLIKQHPRRDEPRVDSIESDDVPPP